MTTKCHCQSFVHLLFNMPKTMYQHGGRSTRSGSLKSSLVEGGSALQNNNRRDSCQRMKVLTGGGGRPALMMEKRRNL